MKHPMLLIVYKKSRFCLWEVSAKLSLKSDLFKSKKLCICCFSPLLLETWINKLNFVSLCTCWNCDCFRKREDLNQLFSRCLMNMCIARYAYNFPLFAAFISKLRHTLLSFYDLPALPSLICKYEKCLLQTKGEKWTSWSCEFLQWFYIDFISELSKFLDKRYN